MMGCVIFYSQSASQSILLVEIEKKEKEEDSYGKQVESDTEI